MTPHLPKPAKWLFTVVALAAIYFVAARYSLLLAFETTNASPVWPPSGIAFAAVFLLGYRVWPGIALGALIANVVVFMGNQVADPSTIAFTSTTIAAGNTLEALVGAFFLRRLVGDRSPFDQPRDVFKFVLIALLTCVIGAAIGAATLLLGKIAPPSSLGTISLTWWLGDAAGILIVAPVLIAWVKQPSLRWRPRMALEIGSFAAFLVALGVLVFGERDLLHGAGRLLAYPFIPCLAWAAFRYGPRGVATASLVVTGMAIWGTIHGLGPFAKGSLNDSLIALDAFVGLCTVTGLALAADLIERQRFQRLSAFGRDIAAPWLVLLASLAVTVVSWHLIASNSERRASDRFDYLADIIKTRIGERLLAYEQILRSAAGLFAASIIVDRREWQVYVEQLKIEKNYPGLQGIAFVQRIHAADKDAHIRKVHMEGFPQYDIRPAGERDEYTPIVYIEPFNERNQRAFGYDMFTEPVRRAAMTHARDSGETTISHKLKLQQETDHDVQAGFLMYVPMYRNGSIGTVEERRAALVGYVTSAFRMNNLMEGILGKDFANVALEIFDNAKTANDSLMYSSAPSNALDNSFSAERTLNIGNHFWTLRFTSLPAFQQTIDRQKAQFVLIAGICFSLLFFALVRSLSVTGERARALAKDMTAAMRESETKFQSLAQSATEAIIIANTRGNVGFWNEGAHNIFGYKEAEIIGQPLERLMPERYRELHRRGLERMRSTGEAHVIGQTVKLAGLTKDGREFPLELSLASWETKAGRFYSGIIRDITEQTHAEDALRRSEERFRLMVDSVVDYAIFMLDLEGNVATWNIGAERMLGYSAYEIIGQNCSRFHTREDVERGHPQRVLQIAAAESWWEDEGWRMRKDGTTFWMNVVTTALHDESGALRGFSQLARDLSERQRQQLELRTRQAELEAVNDASPLGMFRTDEQGRCLYVNRTYENISGLILTDAMGYGWSDAVHPDDRERVVSEWRSATEHHATYGSVHRLLRADGQVVWVSVKATPILVEDVVTGYVGTADDITVRRASEEARRMLAAILEATSDFVATTDSTGRVLYINPAGRRLSGIALDADVTRNTIGDFYPGWVIKMIVEQAAPIATRDGVWVGETAVWDKDHREVPIQHMVIAQKTAEGHVEFFASIMRDASAAKEAERRLRTLAEFDTLTGLANRHQFNEKLAQAIAKSEQYASPMAIMFLDIDYFKSINDTYGHQAGDEVLKEFARRLKETVRASDTVARLAGDEFVIILEGLTSSNNAQQIAANVVQSMLPAFNIMNVALKVSTSIGVAVRRPGEINAEPLMHRADKALYVAKTEGRNTFKVVA
jgi:diguanylate cyclase (GGDEF)-like protein/PAS domain S-box-containing protein